LVYALPLGSPSRPLRVRADGAAVELSRPRKVVSKLKDPVVRCAAQPKGAELPDITAEFHGMAAAMVVTLVSTL
jgi:hypothetical protein